jgi:hypothetical protein
VKALWEERFDKKYGYWRGFVDNVVARYLDCGVAEAIYEIFRRNVLTGVSSWRKITKSFVDRRTENMSPKKPEPTAAELEILQILWANGPSWRNRIPHWKGMVGC